MSFELQISKFYKGSAFLRANQQSVLLKENFLLFN